MGRHHVRSRITLFSPSPTTTENGSNTSWVNNERVSQVLENDLLQEEIHDDWMDKEAAHIRLPKDR